MERIKIVDDGAAMILADEFLKEVFERLSEIDEKLDRVLRAMELQGWQISGEAFGDKN